MSHESIEKTNNSNRKRKIQIAIVSLLLIMSIITIIYFSNMLEREPRLPQSITQFSIPSNATQIRYSTESDRIILSLSEVQEIKYAIFDYSQANKAIPMMAYVAPSGRIVTAIRICEPCDSRSFWFDEDEAVCSTCGTRWYAETLKGISGACIDSPPTEVDNAISGDDVIFTLASIQALKTQEKTSETTAESKSAARLIIVVPSTITQGQVTPFEVRAIEEFGKVNTQRSDVIKVILGEGYAKVRNPAAGESWSKEVTLELSKGIAIVEILDEIQEVTNLKAVWVTGPSYLEPTSTGVICIGQH